MCFCAFRKLVSSLVSFCLSFLRPVLCAPGRVAVPPLIHSFPRDKRVQRGRGGGAGSHIHGLQRNSIFRDFFFADVSSVMISELKSDRKKNCAISAGSIRLRMQNGIRIPPERGQPLSGPLKPELIKTNERRV